MTDPLSELVQPVWSGLAALRGDARARAALATLLNAGALDAWCGHDTHGNRAVAAIAGVDSPPALRRQLASVVVGRRALWPDDRRILEPDTLTSDDRVVTVPEDCADLDGPRAAWWAVRLLVEAPPVSRTELAARLDGLPRASVRVALRRILAEAPMPDPVVELITAAFEVIGGPGRQAEALARIAADDAQPSQRREVAWRVLMDHDDTALGPIFDQLGATRIHELTRLGFAVGVRRMGVSGELAKDLVDQVAPLDEPTRRDLLDMIEDSRTVEGIPAAALYGPLLRSRIAPELDGILVPALESDGGPLAENAIQATLEGTTDPSAQGRLRRALLTLRTRRIEPPADRGEGARAWVGLCDARGDHPVVLATPNPRGLHRVISLSVRAGGEVRDGFVLDDLPRPRLDAMIQQYRATAELYEVTAAEAAAFLVPAVQCTEGGVTGLPSALQRPTDEVLRHEHHAVTLATEPPEPPPRITLNASRALFRRPRLQTWCLDEADLRDCSIARPPRKASDFDAWTRESAHQIRAGRVRQRFTAMVRQLGRVLDQVGDPEASFALAVARALAAGRGEPFLRVVLEHTAFVPQGPSGPRPLRFGDEGQREDIRRLLAPERPTRVDLATLDVVDCVLASESHLISVDGQVADLRPDVRRAALVAAARTLAGQLRASQPSHEPLAAVFVACGVTPDAAHAVADALWSLGQRFRDEVCADCPVRCWTRGDEPAGRLWAGPGHPAVVAPEFD